MFNSTESSSEFPGHNIPVIALQFEQPVSSKCIYCLNLHTPSSSEHVIQHCAVRGVQSAPVLKREVCRQCNNSFCHIDSMVPPLTLVAVLDALDLPKSKYEGYHSIGVRLCTAHLRSKTCFMIDGARCFVSGPGHSVHLEPRIRLEKFDGVSDVINIDGLPRLSHRVNIFERYTGQGVVVGLGDVRLPKEWLLFKLRRLTDEEVAVVTEVMREAIETKLHRAIAKIAFNFLAWITTSPIENFPHRLDLCGSRFDAVRRFSRVGNSEYSSIVSRDRDFKTRRRLQHEIRLTTEQLAEERELVAYVTLFDLARWRVRLARVCDWEFPYDIGYVWDIVDSRCSWLHASSNRRD